MTLNIGHDQTLIRKEMLYIDNSPNIEAEKMKVLFKYIILKLSLIILKARDQKTFRAFEILQSRKVCSNNSSRC